MIRLFTALALPEDLRSRLAAFRGGIDGARWVAPEIDNLHDRIDRALIGAGHPPEGRKYFPHVTLARFGVREGGARNGQVLRWLEAHDGFLALPFEAREFVLYESHLGGRGPAYTPVAYFPMTGTT